MELPFLTPDMDRIVSATARGKPDSLWPWGMDGDLQVLSKAAQITQESSWKFVENGLLADSSTKSMIPINQSLININ